MTAACGGGTSGPKPGQEAELIYSSGLLVQVLEGLEAAWLTPLIPLVPLAPFVLSTFCASDPPAMPTLTSGEANALLQLDVTNPDFSTGVAKLPAIFANAIWNYSCQCTSGSYTPPTVTQPPGTTVIVQPQAGQTTPCITYYSPGGPGITQSTPRAWGPSSSSVALCFEASNPPGPAITSARVTWGAAPGAGSIGAQTLTFTYSGPGLTNVNHTQTIPANTTSAVFTDAAPSGGYTGTQIGLAGQGGGGAFTFTLVHDVYCNGDYPGTQQPCCPPDSATQGYLDNILKMVTLIQRQSAPFAYVKGTPITGLSGSGELAVQGLIGVQVNPSSIPPWVGVTVGDPDTLWLDSWINWGNADGWSERQFLRSAPFVSFPAQAGQYTKLGYSLGNGLVVDIVPLSREP